MAMPIFAIGIWIDDKKVEGSVLSIDKMRDISDPKLAVVASDLKEGDIVKARCKGFPGLHRCVIGKIGYEGEDEMDKFEDLIDSPLFQELVRKYGSKYRPELGQIIRDASNSDLEASISNTGNNNGGPMALASAHVQKSPIKSTGKKQKPNKNKGNDDPVENSELAPASSSLLPLESAKKSRKSQTEKAKTADKKLEVVASQLELTELASAVLSTTETSEAEPETSESHSLLTSTLVRDSLDVVNSSVEAGTSAKGNTGGCESQALLQEITALRNECSRGKLQVCSLENKVQSLENTVASLWSWTSQIHQEVRFNMQYSQQCVQPSGSERTILHQSVQPSGSEHSVAQQSSAASSQPSSSETTATAPDSDSVTLSEENTTSEEVIAGFTIAQLEYKISHLKSYSKAAVLLFRTLYKEEEYLGKTLVGIAGKPAVDQEKLSTIYEIVKKQFPGVTTQQIRSRLADIMKPSRTKTKPC